jgi:hypothetical protein
MWVVHKSSELAASFVGGGYERKDFDAGQASIPNTYGIDSLSVYVYCVIPIKTVPRDYFTHKGISLTQTIAASSGLTLTSLQAATGVNELVTVSREVQDSDELTHFYVLSNTLDPKPLTLAITFTGVTSLDTIRPFILSPTVFYQEGFYNAPRLVPFDSISSVDENAIISQYVDTTTEELYINKYTKESFVYDRFALADLDNEFRLGNFNSIEHQGVILEKELSFNGKGFIVTDKYVFIMNEHV